MFINLKVVWVSLSLTGYAMILLVLNLASATPISAQSSNGALPPPPAHIHAIATNDIVILLWIESVDDSVTGYQILRREVGHHDEDEFIVLFNDIPHPTTNVLDYNVHLGHTYVYKIRARNQSGLGGTSPEFTIDTPAISDYSVDVDASCDTPVEMGDITAQYSPMQADASVNGATDHDDCYRFEITSTRNVFVGLRRQDANADLFLLDEDEEEIDASEARRRKREDVGGSLDPGTYFVLVKAKTMRVNKYILRYYVEDPAPPPPPPQTVPLTKSVNNGGSNDDEDQEDGSEQSKPGTKTKIVETETEDRIVLRHHTNDPDYEDVGHTAETARPVSLNTTYEGFFEDASSAVGLVCDDRLGSGMGSEILDVDWYSFRADPGTTYTFVVASQTIGVDIEFDLDMAIKSSNGQFLAWDNSDGDSNPTHGILEWTPAFAESSLVYAEAIGTQYHYVFSIRTDGQTSLDVGELLPRPDPVESPAETVDVGQTFDTAGRIFVNDRVESTLSDVPDPCNEDPVDEDWFALDVFGGVTYELILEVPGHDPESDEAVNLRLLQDHGPLEAVDGGVRDEDATHHSLVWTAPYDATFYVVVEGRFRDYVLYADDGTGGCAPWWSEPPAHWVGREVPPDATTEASVLANGMWNDFTVDDPNWPMNFGRYYGEIDFIGDADWIRFWAVAGDRYQVDVLGEGHPWPNVRDLTLEDPWIYLIHAPDGSEIPGTHTDFGDHGAGPGESTAIFRASETGWHYVNAQSFIALGKGTYAVQVFNLSDSWGVPVAPPSQ